MDRLKGTVAAVIILVLGWCAALPFRRPPSTKAVASSVEAELAAMPSGVTLHVEQHPTSGRFLLVEDTEVRRRVVSDVAPRTAPKERPIDRARPAPARPDRYGLLLGGSVGGEAGHPRLSLGGDSPETQPRSREILHRLVDGDSLRSLAEAYLGDPNRADDIFDVNRDVLDHPDVLPVNKLIRIPTSPLISPRARENHPTPTDDRGLGPVRVNETNTTG